MFLKNINRITTQKEELRGQLRRIFFFFFFNAFSMVEMGKAQIFAWRSNPIYSHVAGALF